MTRLRSTCRRIYTITAVKWVPLSLCIFFLLVGVVLIPYAGIQADEALFGEPIYRAWIPADSLTIGDHQLPLMLMSYLGTLKTLLYAWLFHRWRPGVWSLRVPMLVAGAVVIWLFGRLLERTCGRRAAILGCALLATDATFLLTTIFDWGPVALQHLLMVGGALLILAFAQEGSRLKLAFGFFLFGLAMWDKALAAWWLGGLGVATLCVFPREVIRRLTPRYLLIAVVAFALGALPLIIFNVRNPLATFQGNAKFSTDQLSQKVHLLRVTLEGDGLFGYIVREEEDGPIRTPKTAIEQASVAMRDALGQRRRGLFFYLFLIAIAAVPLWWRKRRPVFFALIVLAVAWIQMAFTKDAGGGIHHTVLLFPFPQFVVAVVFGSATWPRLKPLLASTIGMVCLSNVIVTNQYLSQFVRNGSGPLWTDAITPLSAAIRPYRARHIFAMDWGIEGTLRILHRGQLPTLWNGEENIQTGNIEPVLALNGIYITHAPGAEVNAGSAARLRTLAENRGYHQMIRDTISDRNGRPIFYVSEFEKSVPR